MNAILTTAQSIAKILAQANIKFVYGLPGGASLPLIAALKQEDIQFILVRNESSAVYMAEVTARLTGTVGVCLVTLGPGATNAYAGIANAWLDRAPVLIITADFPQAMKDAGHTHQVLDLTAVFQPVTKWTTEITPDNVHETIQQALNLAQNGRPGPIHLSLTAQAADTAIGDLKLDAKSSIPITQSPIPNTLLKNAHSIIAQSHKPIILTGLGLEPERPYPQLLTLAETLNAPVIDTPKSKGSFPNSHPLHGGTLGLTQTDPAYTLLNEADCILAIGFDVVELVKPWDYTKPLLWISTWANDTPPIPATVELVGSLPQILADLIDNDCTSAPDWGEQRVRKHRQSSTLPSRPVLQNSKMWPQDVLTAVRGQLPANTFTSTDVGSHKILTALDWPVDIPNRYAVSNGLSAMGFGLPAAIAASLILNQPTLSIHGDGGFQMVMGELGLITEYDLPVIILILNDNALDLIRAKQIRRDEPVHGTEFVNPDFAHIAKAYQIEYQLVQDSLSCEEAVKKALQNGRSIIIEAPIDPASYPTAPNSNTIP